MATTDVSAASPTATDTDPVASVDAFLIARGGPFYDLQQRLGRSTPGGARLAGTTDFYRALTGDERIKPFVCPGRELTRRELAEILLNWARGHGAHMGEFPVESVVRATVARFPCGS